MTKIDQILHGDQTKRDDFFTGSTTPPALANLFVTQMLTCNLFAVANVLVHLLM